MTVYLDLVVFLNFLVDGLLLMGANRLTGYPAGVRRCALAAALGSVYAGLCMLPSFRFLGNILWRTVCLGAMAAIAYGRNRSALRRGTIFVLLSMALGGMATGIGRGNFVSLALAAAGVLLLCTLGVHAPLGIEKYQPVVLRWKGQELKLTALVDTGNALTDPITGASVLVVGEDVGIKLGISREMIRDPIGTIAKEELPGVRLIPYRAVGKPGGMMLMLRLDRVLLGKKEISPMVAFAPQEIGKTDGYQALAGGVV